MIDRSSLREIHKWTESQCLSVLSERLPFLPESIQADTVRLIDTARSVGRSELDAFLQEYRLSSQEGVALMCLAEALLRIPDVATADQLIVEKLGNAHWVDHLRHSDSWLVNASTWGLMLTGRVVRMKGALSGILGRAGEPLIRAAVTKAVEILAGQFVMGRNIEEALDRSHEAEKLGFRHSFDMLGEGARCQEDADRHFDQYRKAIMAVGARGGGRGPFQGPGVSIKLSALHPRYETGQTKRVRNELTDRVRQLGHLAKYVNIGLTIDAEEAARLELSLDLLEGLQWWDGLGVAVQAYQKRAIPLIETLVAEAKARRCKLTIRLVKGAYWDTEIKRAQELGLAGYPVFTTKQATDRSYLVCASLLADAADGIYPAFATHNAHSVVAIGHLMNGHGNWEFQRLHGMGDAIYRHVVADYPVRTYAPVGAYEDLLPYLVRRLLENGANSSFVNQMADVTFDATRLAKSLIPTAEMGGGSVLATPRDLFGYERKNSLGWDLSQPDDAEYWQQVVMKPLELAARKGCDANCVNRAIDDAKAAAADWDAVGGQRRAEILENAADALERAPDDFVHLLVREAGKTLPDSLSEIRETVDFLRYYAAQARRLFAGAEELHGPTGESNMLSLRGRGVFACISPWNFPLAIFTGQIAAALAAGNGVVAKPAPQTPLVARMMVDVFHDAGVPKPALGLVTGGPATGEAVVAHPGIDGVAFTGSTGTAVAINRVLAARSGPIIPLIAETGGINAMIVDSSALLEQVVDDVLLSAFRSAGQRCSALRILFVQEESASRLEHLLIGAASELKVGDPGLLETDIGPVIDIAARDRLQEHACKMEQQASLLFRGAIPKATRGLAYFPPTIFRLSSPDLLKEEVFGPILHIVHYKFSRLEDVVNWIDKSGWGLTLGIHSRIDAFAERIAKRVSVGNIYVNRSQIGATVGVQPFGGSRLSGTGPKAGGPYSLFRYATETVMTINQTARGGNIDLLTREPSGPAQSEGA
jgi:RHH-type proline utilization regulon transcriptional repressor/proline dehydrogenase/delta 1-pyrroline-5-carboxylate dehydrogenase